MSNEEPAWPPDFGTVIAALSAALPDYLQAQRWFGDKGRAIQTVSVARLEPRGTLLLTIVDVAFVEGRDSLYFVPVINESQRIDEAAEPITIVSGADGNQYLYDAVPLPTFHKWIAAELSSESADPQHSFAWSPTGRIPANLLDIARQGARLMGVEQSNSAIRFGDEMLVKIFRKLQVGPNPEVELSGFLSTRTSFTHAPRLFGSCALGLQNGDRIDLAVAQEWVAGVGDGWSFTLDHLAHLTDTGSAEQQIWRDLGTRTAEMHLALASDPWTPDLSPENITMENTATWRASFTASVERLAGLLHRTSAIGDERTRELTATFVKIAPRLASHADRFDLLRGRKRIRVHGDYHLGQTIRTIANDWTILDFEGEPMRPIDERRQKTSPLKDVAGMLRSLNYARGAALQAGDASSEATLAGWENNARAALIDGYASTIRSESGDVLPDSDEDLRLALSAWEADKAIYEIEYELRNRPDWLWLPLSAVLKLA